MKGLAGIILKKQFRSLATLGYTMKSVGTPRFANSLCSTLHPGFSANKISLHTVAFPTLHEKPQQSIVSSTVSPKRQAARVQAAKVKQEAIVHHVREAITGSWQYVVADPSTSHAIIINPVLDYDVASAKISTWTANRLLSTIKEKGYTVQMVLETHAHADHLTAANYLKHKLATLQEHAPAVGIGKRIVEVQRLWASRYGIPDKEYVGAFDKLFEDNEVFQIGTLTGAAVHLPGHTLDHMGYMIGGKLSAISWFRCTVN